TAPATPAIYTLSLHDALPISEQNTPTSRAWTVVSGPTGVGSTIGTAAALSFTPSTAGTYTLRYSATNSAGTGTDDVVLTVNPPRSEEHTSELQSRGHLVCRLL